MIVGHPVPGFDLAILAGHPEPEFNLIMFMGHPLPWVGGGDSLLCSMIGVTLRWPEEEQVLRKELWKCSFLALLGNYDQQKMGMMVNMEVTLD